MRYVVGFLCVCALGLMPLVGCSETAGDGGGGGTAGDGGSGGTVASGCDRELCEGIDCDDADPCTRGVCNVADGTCSYVATCDDFNDCTTEMCNPADESCSTPVPVANGTSCAGGTCQSGACVLSGSALPCTEQGIRNAIAAGNDTYTFTCDGTAPVVTQAEIEIDNDVILDGEGRLTVNGNCEHRVFSVPQGVTAEMNGFTITKGLSLDGVGIENRGTLTIANCTVSECEGDLGGAVANSGTMTMANCTVSGNWSDFAAGIFNNEELTMTNCTVSGNTSAGNGGGVTNAGDGRLTITNCTVSGNKAGSEGGGILNAGDGTLTIANSTVSGNTAAKGGGIMSFNAGALSVANSLIEGNCTTEDSATAVSSGYNIESPRDTCGFDPDGTDQVNVSADDLKLGELVDNGGPTMTHALLPGSVAIDQLPAEDCLDANGEPLTTDQRGEPRPETGGTMCDVGSVEVQP